MVLRLGGYFRDLRHKHTQGYETGICALRQVPVSTRRYVSLLQTEGKNMGIAIEPHEPWVSVSEGHMSGLVGCCDDLNMPGCILKEINIPCQAILNPLQATVAFTF